MWLCTFRPQSEAGLPDITDRFFCSSQQRLSEKSLLKKCHNFHFKLACDFIILLQYSAGNVGDISLQGLWVRGWVEGAGRSAHRRRCLPTGPRGRSLRCPNGTECGDWVGVGCVAAGDHSVHGLILEMGKLRPRKARFPCFFPLHLLSTSLCQRLN